MFHPSRRQFFFMAFLLLGAFCFPLSLSEGFRAACVCCLTRSCQFLANFKANPFYHNKEDPVATIEEENRRLKLENQLLQNEANRLKELYEQEFALLSQGLEDRLTEIDDGLNISLDYRDRFIRDLFQLKLLTLPARVIFRSPNSWNSSFWVDVGEENNISLGEQVVAKNSPVVLGDAIVGVVDYVGKKQSRVRLITDMGLNPSVRVFREGRLLAKGELSGKSHPLWRAHSQTLQGIGFNYDFADSEGPARDLRTGEPQGVKGPNLPILLPNDLLVTTGMDGVFPAGFKAGTVISVKPLKEGDYYYGLEALPAAGNLEELSLVFILPPISDGCCE